MSSIIKNLLIALIITLLLAAVYFFFLRDRLGSGEFDAGGIENADGNVDIDIQSARVLADTQRIKSYRIEEHQRILTDIRFTSLVDRRTAIPEVPTGRANPFDPVE